MKEKKYKVLLASRKTLTVSSDPAFLLFHWVFYVIHVIVGLKKKIQDHRRLFGTVFRVVCGYLKPRTLKLRVSERILSNSHCFQGSQPIFVDKKAAKKK